MFWYFVKLVVLLPMVAGMAYAALWLWRKYQPGMMGAQADRAIKVIETMPMGTFGKLSVVEFDGQRLLVSVTRNRIEKIADGKTPVGFERAR
ncbi:MAG: flagellar biosynthetic protein FliO [Sphingobium sp.]